MWPCHENGTAVALRRECCCGTTMRMALLWHHDENGTAVALRYVGNGTAVASR